MEPKGVKVYNKIMNREQTNLNSQRRNTMENETLENKIDALAKKFEEKESFIEKWEKKYHNMSTFKKVLFWVIVVPLGWFLFKALKKKLNELIQEESMF